jgi:hypothetical protein
MTRPNAEFDLVTDPRPGYLFARVRTVALTPEVALRLLGELRMALLNARRARLLLEYEVAFTLTEEEVLQFVNITMEVLSGMRIALVAADAKHAPSLSFGTAVANYSGHEHRFFTNATAAEEWLLEDPE